MKSCSATVLLLTCFSGNSLAAPSAPRANALSSGFDMERNAPRVNSVNNLVARDDPIKDILEDLLPTELTDALDVLNEIISREEPLPSLEKREETAQEAEAQGLNMETNAFPVNSFNKVGIRFERLKQLYEALHPSTLHSLLELLNARTPQITPREVPPSSLEKREETAQEAGALDFPAKLGTGTGIWGGLLGGKSPTGIPEGIYGGPVAAILKRFFDDLNKFLSWIRAAQASGGLQGSGTPSNGSPKVLGGLGGLGGLLGSLTKGLGGPDKSHD